MLVELKKYFTFAPKLRNSVNNETKQYTIFGGRRRDSNRQQAIRERLPVY